MFIRLSDTPNRAILYDLYPYIWDVKEVVLLLDSFVNWLGELSCFTWGWVGGGGGGGRCGYNAVRYTANLIQL